MKNITLTIAGIPLAIKSIKSDFSTPAFKRFQSNPDKPANNRWQLESLGIDKTPFFQPRQLFKNKISLIKKRFIFSDQSQAECKEKQKKLSCLHSIYPNIWPSTSFYFSDPVEINLKKRKINHFYVKENATDEIAGVDSRLITFAYSQILASLQGILLHGACVIKGNEAFLFLAKGGGGKSTVAKLSKKYCVLGDDVIAVRQVNGKFLAFSTPWKQKKFIRPQSNLKAKIKAVFFLKKANYISFKPLRPEEALVKLLSQQIHFFLYTEKPLAEKIFFTAANLFKAIPAYEMHFRKNDNFWPMLEKTINDQK